MAQEVPETPQEGLRAAHGGLRDRLRRRLSGRERSKTRRRAQGGNEKEQAFSEGGGTSQKPGGLLRSFLSLLRRQRELLRSPGGFSEASEGPPLLISPPRPPPNDVGAGFRHHVDRSASDDRGFRSAQIVRYRPILGRWRRSASNARAGVAAASTRGEPTVGRPRWP